MTNYSQRKPARHNNEIHKTTCADCGKMCEVPFKPNGKKPVYCQNCFAKNGGQVTTNHFSTRPRPTFAAPPARPQQDSKALTDLSRQVEELNTKIDKLTEMVEALSSSEK